MAPAASLAFRSLPILCLVLAANAQVAWQRVPYPPGRTNHFAATDPGTGQAMVGYGYASPSVAASNSIWRRDAAARFGWREDTTATPRPGSRIEPAVALDYVRRRLVLFGGYIALNDTWEFDGATWRQITTPASPPARFRSAMAFDPVRNRIVLFGGDSGGLFGELNDTWEYDGVTWTRVVTATTPLPRRNHALFFDPSRGRVVLFGGTVIPNGLFGDQWTFDGTNWQPLVTPTVPPARWSAAVCFDPARGVGTLFGGIGDPQGFLCLNDTWQLTATNWQQVATPSAPLVRGLAAMAWDTHRNRIVLYGGATCMISTFSATLPDTWEFDGSTWAQAEAGPPVGTGVMAFDGARARTVLFGDMIQGQHAEWDGQAWVHRTLAPLPSRRELHAMCFDSARGRTVLFGGFARPAGIRDDTWEFDGTAWAQQMISGPPARQYHAMAFDSVRRRVVLFGGSTNGLGTLGDTWEYDGTAWQQLSPTTTPAARFRHALAYDRARQRVVLYGGSTGGGGSVLADTWEWDGAQWQQRTPGANPGNQFDHRMVYDDHRERVVMVTFNGSVWEWDGGTWTQRTGLQARQYAALAFDAAAGKVVLHGGYVTTTRGTDETWLYGPAAPARVDAFGTGCAGSAGTPTLRTEGGRRPWLTDTLVVEASPVPATSAALLWLGASRTQWAGFALPIDLAILGMPGCFLLAAPDVQFPAGASGRRVSWPLPVCACPELLGLSIFAQITASDPPANALGFVVSNGIELVLGAR